MLKYLLVIFLAFLNFIALSYLNLETPVFVEQKFECISWNPYRHLTREPKYKEKIPEEIISSDLDAISKYSNCVRVYFSTSNMESAVRYAKVKGLKFILGAYISSDDKRSIDEIDSAGYLSSKYDNIVAVIVGNEHTSKSSIRTNNGIPLEKHIKYLTYSRTKIKVPISTSDIPSTWVKNRKMQDYVDFISINFLPYWYHKSPKQGAEWLVEKYKKAKKYFPNKVVFIAETGWPTHGVVNSLAVPGVIQQNQFIRSFQSKSKETFSDSKEYLGIGYNFFEAFDQPWKSRLFEGKTGAHWGLARASGKSKYADKIDLEDKSLKHNKYNNSFFALLVSCNALLFSVLVIKVKKYRSIMSLLWLLVSIYISVSSVYLVIHSAKINYLLLNYLSVFIIPFILIPVFISLIFVFECCDAFERKEKLNQDNLVIKNQNIALPFVSIHIPFSNEDPQMVIKTLKSVLNLNYPSFEIIAMSNNTKNLKLWTAVKSFCDNHLEKIKFFHEQELSGYKAGALNYCLKHISESAEYIAVLDSDYIVDRNWLKECIPLFFNDSENTSKIAAVQCPQSYRITKNTAFENAMYAEYDSFFKIGMNLRNEKNAIIMHGTMLIINKQVLNKFKWAQWSICEDAELGLRMLSAGFKIYYHNHILGKGVLPASYKSYAKQRFRWVYGGIQILIKHYKKFIKIEGNLNLKQISYYFLGWLPWISEALFLLFCISGFFTASTILETEQAVPGSTYLIPLLILFFSRLISILLVYLRLINYNIKNTVLAFVSGISLTYSISLAAIFAFIYPKYSFDRTVKVKREKERSSLVSLKIVNLILKVPTQLLVSTFFITLSSLIWIKYGLKDMDRNIWLVIFVILALPGLASFVMRALEAMHYKKQIIDTNHKYS